jgi:hypothetical protein
MGLAEPMLIAVGIGGIIFMFYALSAMQLLKGKVRFVAISALMMVIILLSNRLLDNRLDNRLAPNSSTNSLWDLLPLQDSANQDPGLAQTGWQDIPFNLVFGLLLNAFDPQQSSPSASPVPASPVPASPVPASPPPASLIPASPTVPPPSPSLITPASPTPSLPTAPPSPVPSPVQPSLPPKAVQPIPQPSFQPAPVQPSPTQPPVSAWW